MIELKKGMRILFQGDSITDNLRADVTEFIGCGYTRFVSSYLRGSFPQLNLEFVNRAVSGNRTCDLVERWDWDTIHVKPDVCSIMIGVNDCWRRYDSNDPTSAEQFEKNYRNILDKCKANNIKYILYCLLCICQSKQYKMYFNRTLFVNDTPGKRGLAQRRPCFQTRNNQKFS